MNRDSLTFSSDMKAKSLWIVCDSFEFNSDSKQEVYGCIDVVNYVATKLGR